MSPYLLRKYRSHLPGEVLLEYDGKLLLRTTDGVVKVTLLARYRMQCGQDADFRASRDKIN